MAENRLRRSFEQERSLAEKAENSVFLADRRKFV